MPKDFVMSKYDRTQWTYGVKKIIEAYTTSFRPNDAMIPSENDIADFIEYCLDFYGHGGIYDYGFQPWEVVEGTIKRFGYRPSMDFDGDTVDREYVREMVFEIREQEVA
jgi:hypothetical protein